MILSAETFSPGEHLCDELNARGLNAHAFALRTGLSLETVTGILERSTPITPASAVAIANALGTSPELWMNLQTAFAQS